MAVRLNRMHQDSVRAKIKASCIIKALQEHIDGQRELTASQVASAKILLDKSVSNAPNLTELTGADGKPLELTWPLPKPPREL